MEERGGKVWSLTDEDGESYPCEPFARMKNASSANKRERERDSYLACLSGRVALVKPKKTG